VLPGHEDVEILDDRGAAEVEQVLAGAAIAGTASLPVADVGEGMLDRDTLPVYAWTIVTNASLAGTTGGWPRSLSLYSVANSSWNADEKSSRRFRRKNVNSFARLIRFTTACSAADNASGGSQTTGRMRVLLSHSRTTPASGPCSTAHRRYVVERHHYWTGALDAGLLPQVEHRPRMTPLLH